MSGFTSIRSKLIFNITLLIAGTFIILLSVIIASNVISVNKSLEKTKLQIRSGLIAKGKLLAKNNSLAMNGMAQDNAFTAIQNLVASTVAGDDDLVYGVYMDRERKPWVIADSENPEGIPGVYKPLDDSVSLWAGSITGPDHKEYVRDGVVVIEFAAPVGEAEALGYIRYGISTAVMESMILEARANSKRTMVHAIVIVFAMGLFSLLAGYIVLRQLAFRITLPIGALAESSKIIAEGNYDVAVKPQSSDEVGRLAEHFELMRVTIKKYTDHLQVLIDEKMQQVKDILNAIDQGLFTINPDGSVNNEYSARANEILKVEDVASCTLGELLRCDAAGEAAFGTWLDLVRKQHKKVRWSKLAKLAPVQELELPASSGSSDGAYVVIDYQSICDKNGNLLKIMVLAFDETEKRARDRQMVAERRKHENDVKTILSISHTPAEELAEFLDDTTTRIHEVKVEIDRHLTGVNRRRDYPPDAGGYPIVKEQVDRMYRDLHTIKGNCGSYDFDRLASLAHDAEGLLERLREPLAEQRDIILQDLRALLNAMDQAQDDIHQKVKLIFGSDEELTVRIPEARVNKLVELGGSLLDTSGDPQVRNLAGECVRLSWKPAKSLLRKYQKLAQKIARKLHKNINVSVPGENVLYPSNFLADIDEILIHLIRNAVDHGIEASEVREELGKGIGHITLLVDREGGRRVFSVTDDGSGFDIDKIVTMAVANSVISQEEASLLSNEEKIGLLYRGGLSTSESVTGISGRGVGMQIIHRKVEEVGGTMSIESKFGKGTVISLSLPDVVADDMNGRPA